MTFTKCQNLGGNNMKCKKCGQEVDKKAVICTGCGCKIKKPIYKKWWFWVFVAVIVVIIGNASGKNETPANITNDTSKEVEQVEQIEYEIVDLQTMFDDLSNNAMKAENMYQNKYIEFECKINSFDSDGSYISVEPVGADKWNFTTAMCYIKNGTQKEFLMDKNVGDIVTIKGKIRSVGEVLGYSIDINEVY